MSKPVKGRMVVHTRQGQFGSFNYAFLYTEIGEFVVRYNALDEFSADEYKGVFYIKEIYQKSRKFGVSIIIDNIAVIDDVNLEYVVNKTMMVEPEAIEDPIEEESLLDSSNNSKSSNLVSTINEIEKKQLFGELFPLGNLVKLDPTVGRAVLRNQAEYLKKIGYSFVADNQTWIKND